MNAAEQAGRRAHAKAVGPKFARTDRNLAILQHCNAAGGPKTAEETRRYYHLVLLDLCEAVTTPRLRQAIAYAERRIAEDRAGANPTT